MTKIKLCGLQQVEHGIVAAEAGADYIGLNFVPSSRRKLTIEQAKAFVDEFNAKWGQRAAPAIVGLFADQPIDEVNAAIAAVKLDMVQLCGEEGMGYCKQVQAPIFKVIGIDPNVPTSVVLPRLMTLMQRHSMAGHSPVLDTRVAGAYGGTGVSFKWDFLEELYRSFKFGLAGGLNPENVTTAIRQAHPWAVDVSSGIETDGLKDPNKIRVFIQAVRHADKELAPPRGLAGLFRRGQS